MTDTSADAGVVQSRVQLERLVAVDELAGRTIAGFAAPSVLLRALDLDGVTLDRLDLRGCDGDETRLERAELNMSDLRTSQWKGALWNRVRTKDCVILKTTFEGYAHATVSLSRTDFSGAALFDVDFKQANLYGANLKNAMLVRCNLRGANLCMAELAGARLVGCETSGVDLDGATW